jgi:hypothetical protein
MVGADIGGGDESLDERVVLGREGEGRDETEAGESRHAEVVDTGSVEFAIAVFSTQSSP